MSPPLAAVVDAREPEWVKALTWGGPAAPPDYLPFGDLWLTAPDWAVLCIERKTPSDFLGSLRDGRLFRQLAGLRAQTPWAYLLITGHLAPAADGTVVCWGGAHGQTPDASSWRYDAVQGALLTAQETGVHVVHCAGDRAFQGTCARLARRNRGPHRRSPVRADGVLDVGEAFLCGLPGIGPEKARALLADCGSPAWALSCLTDRGALPNGFGETLRTQARQTLGLEAGTFLAVNCEEPEVAIRPTPEEILGA